MQSSSLKVSFRLIQWATVALFLGRAWQHLFWDAPFRILLWDERWMKGIVQGIFKTPWQDYITSLKVDDAIQMSIHSIGIFYLVCALVAAFVVHLPKWVAKILYLGSTSLFFLAILYCKERFFSVGQLLEYSLQVVSPLLLYFWLYPKWTVKTYRLIAKIAMALTFSCHGLYAINFYPRPGNFVEMVINTLGVSEATAIEILFIAGLMDFVVSIAIFLPGKISQMALGYIIFWGFSTTFSRYTSYLDWNYLLESLNQWSWEVLIRFPHFMIPLGIFLFQAKRNGLKLTKSQKNIETSAVIFPET